MASVKFYLEKKPNKKSDQNIFAQVSLGVGEKFKIYPGIRIRPDIWIHEQQRVEANETLTSELEAFRQEILLEYRRLHRKLGKEPGAEELKLHIRSVLLPQQAGSGKSRDTQKHGPSLLKLVELRVEDGNKIRFSTGTKAMYQGLMANLSNFSDKYGHSLKLRDFDYRLYNAFQKYLVQDLRYLNESANNHLKKLKASVSHYLKKHSALLLNDEYDRLSRLVKEMDMLGVKKDTPRQRMTIAEVMRFYRHDLSARPDLDLVRDRYVFCCFTGLRTGSLNILNSANLTTDTKGRSILRFEQAKGRQQVTTEVPLNQIALALVAKYSRSNERLLFPRVSGDANELLREALVICGGFDQELEKSEIRGTEVTKEIKKRYDVLTFHTSRHTFASYLLNQGMSLEYVQDMLGHASIATTAIYARADRESVLDKASDILNVPLMKVG